MPSPAELAWLIPVLPLVGAALVGLGLISFNRTVNRLRKPVALLLITSVGAAAVLSYAVLAQQLAGAGPTEVLFNWASAGAFTLEMVRRERLERSTGFDPEWVLDAEDIRTIAGTMGRFPSFRDTGWRILSQARIVEAA